MPTKNKAPKDYENNPFFVAANGISLLFNLAKGVAIFLIVVSLFGVIGGWTPDNSSNGSEDWNALVQTLSSWTPNEWILAIGAITVIGLAIMLVSALFGGVSAYTSARIARGHQVSVSEAFRVAFDELWSYLWLQIIIFVKLFLWTLLFIVPGIIMSVRYSLAGVSYFDDKKNLRGNAAIKESLRLTKGAWLTTFASSTLFNILTFGIISSLVTTGANAMLYKQFDKHPSSKPQAHFLSWLTLVLPFAVVIGLILFAVFIAIALGIGGATTSP